MTAAFPKRALGADEQRGVIWIALGALPLLGFWLHAAWVSEDAHITFRAIENLLDGRGLRWNPDERVQVFSHPLWLFALAPIYAAIGSVAWSVTLLALGCSLAAYAILARALGATPAVVIGLTLPWLLSGCLTRYATSGFENPLTHLLLAVQAAQMLALRAGRALPWGRLCLVAALAGVNRLDTLALHAPILAALLISAPRRFAWGRAAAGLLPLVAWLLFSIGYFGFFLPNTAYAKLARGVSFATQLSHGAEYARDFAARDLESAVLLLAGWATAVAFAARGLRNREPCALGLAGLGAGSLCYCIIVVWGGGDFLAGRHFAAPVFASLAVCGAALGTTSRRWSPASRPWRVWSVAGAGVALLVLSLGGSALRAHVPATVLERSAAHLALTTCGWEATPRAEDFREIGRRIDAEARAVGASAAVLPVIGIATREIDRELILIDPFALAEPLLARLPPSNPHDFVPGHAEREIPAGYLEARETGDTSGMHPALAEYYAQLRRVVSGPIFGAARWRSIWKFQRGVYDPLLRSYLESRELAVPRSH